MTGSRIAVRLLLALLDGAVFANATRQNGKPCRIRLPVDPDSRATLVAAHLRGAPSTLTFHAGGHAPWRERVAAVSLAAFCAAADGRCGWVGIDLDAADHGVTGLLDPICAARAIAERAANAGLMTGLLIVRSRRGRGRHVFLLLPVPVTLVDGVIGVAALAGAAFKVAARDVAEYGACHAFQRVNGAITRPGDPGAVELFPRSTAKPTHGWPLALPAAGVLAAHGGGVIVNPFDDRPIDLECVPRCDHEAWSRFLEETRATLSKRNIAAVAPLKRRLTDGPRRPLDRVDARTWAFLDGYAPEGTRNMSAFAASANLLGCGMEHREAERLIVTGAAACGLPQREALNAFKSALAAITRKQRHA